MSTDQPDPDDEHESGISWSNIALAAVGVVAGIGLAHAGRRVVQRWDRGVVASDMADRVCSVARHLATPAPPLDYVGPGDPRWDDQVMGGIVAPGKWRLFEDSHGSSCAVFATAALAGAGVAAWTSPLTGASGRLLLNYDPPAGVGFVPGAWQKRFLDGGRACGILKNDAIIKPGDLYCSIKGNDPARWHVEIALEVSGDGRILAAAGGQNGPPSPTAPRGVQCARLVRRQLRGKTISTPGGGAEPGEIQWRLTWP